MSEPHLPPATSIVRVPNSPSLLSRGHPPVDPITHSALAGLRESGQGLNPLAHTIKLGLDDPHPQESIDTRKAVIESGILGLISGESDQRKFESHEPSIADQSINKLKLYHVPGRVRSGMYKLFQGVFRSLVDKLRSSENSRAKKIERNIGQIITDLSEEIKKYLPDSPQLAGCMAQIRNSFVSFLEAKEKDPEGLRSLTKHIQTGTLNRLHQILAAGGSSAKAECEQTLLIMNSVIAAIQEVSGEHSLLVEQKLDLSKNLLDPSANAFYSLSPEKWGEQQKMSLFEPGEARFEAIENLNKDIVRDQPLFNQQRVTSLGELLTLLKAEGIPDNKIGYIASLYSQNTLNTQMGMLTLREKRDDDLDVRLKGGISNLSLDYNKDTGELTLRSQVFIQRLGSDESAPSLAELSDCVYLQGSYESSLEIRGCLTDEAEGNNLPLMDVKWVVRDLLSIENRPLYNLEKTNILAYSEHVQRDTHPMKKCEYLLLPDIIKSQVEAKEVEIKNLEQGIARPDATDEMRVELASLKSSVADLNRRCSLFLDVRVGNLDSSSVYSDEGDRLATDPTPRELLDWGKKLVEEFVAPLN